MAPYEAEIAPYRFEALEAIGRVTLRPRPVNWKNVADNYSDGLHINVAHPGLTRLFGQGYGIAAEEHVDRMYGDLLDRPSSNPSERAYQAMLPEVEHLPVSHRRRWLYFKLWPNLAFDIYPDQVDFMQFLPVSPTETLIREISYAVPDDRREMKVARYLNWRINRRVNAEDTALIEGVQRGMASASYTPGRGTYVLPATGLRVGALLCLEAMDPRLVRRAVDDGAEVLVNLSNDTWIGHPEPAGLQLDIATLRAVESRRWLVRAASTGISAIVDPQGRTLSESGFATHQVLHSTVRTSRIRSPYQRWGDGLAWIVVAITAGTTLATARIRRRSNR